jgi:hypothetical protein
MEDYSISSAKLRKDLQKVLNRHGVTQNLHLTQLTGGAISVTGQLRPVNENDPAETSKYREAQPKLASQRETAPVSH